MTGTSMRSTFDGKWVNTIVLSKPKRAASQPAARSDNPDNKFTAKNSTASCVGSRPQRMKNQYATSDWTTSAPAKASSPKSAASLATVPRDRWIPRNRRSPWTFASSSWSVRRANSARFASPTIA